MTRIPLFGLILLALLSASRRATATPAFEEWPQWRGPRGDGTSLEQNVPTHWSATQNIAWKTPVPGMGHSSPVVFGDRIFLTTCIENSNQRVLLCYSRKNGRLLWQRDVFTSPLEQINQLNSFASATPCTDGRHVWVSFLEKPNIELVCYDMDGKETWRKSPGSFSSIHGYCSSPVFYKDMILLNCDQDAPAFIVAFDKEAGIERYRINRPNRTRSYCTPTIFDVNGHPQMMLSGSKCVASYNPDTGKQIWIINGPTEQYVASIVMTDGVAFMTGGFPEHHIMGIDPTGTGNLTHTSKILWHNKTDHRAVSYVPSPVAYRDWFFLVSDGGLATCWQATSGKQLWKKPISNHQSASGILAGGNAYFTADDGQTTVFKAGPKFEEVSKNALGEECRASPAVSRGQIFIRTLHTLWCIGADRISRK
ncbi:MAG TPA: PQQ-binding-like beta-propeller repeat protein [Tepidisphaeraceae bacterium]|nr:PQQ-binding-like beta-propeller repeat protein [Tepidisphaeraceae bacterium]